MSAHLRRGRQDHTIHEIATHQGQTTWVGVYRPPEPPSEVEIFNTHIRTYMFSSKAPFFRFLDLLLSIVFITCVAGWSQSSPNISGMSPATGPVGTQVTITGTGFGTETGGVVLESLGGLPIVSWSAARRASFCVSAPSRH